MKLEEENEKRKKKLKSSLCRQKTKEKRNTEEI